MYGEDGKFYPRLFLYNGDYAVSVAKASGGWALISSCSLMQKMVCQDLGKIPLPMASQCVVQISSSLGQSPKAHPDSELPKESLVS